ncbi:hypothetical protein Tco_0927794, partial [Tanacetum coccineum]
PSSKRIRDSGYLADIEAEIDECFTYVNDLKDRGIDARIVVEAVDRVESETGARGLVEVRVERVTHPVMPDDIPEPAQEGAIEVTYETLRDLVQRFHDDTEAILVHRIQVIEGIQRKQGHRIVGVESAVTALTERIAELERDNRRLKGTASVETEEIEAREAAMNLEPLNENGDEQGNGNGRNGGNSNRGNGGNGNGRNEGNGNGGNGENGNEGNGGNGNGGNGGNGNGGNGGNGNGGNG